jgi:hypothetical protein
VWHGGSLCGLLTGYLLSQPFFLRRLLSEASLSPSSSARHWSDGILLILVFQVTTSLKATSDDIAPNIHRWAQMLCPCVDHVAWDHRGRLTDVQSYRGINRTTSQNRDVEAEYESGNDVEDEVNEGDLENGRERFGPSGGQQPPHNDEDDAEEGNFIGAASFTRR